MHGEAVQSITDFGSYGYGCPYPAVGDRAHKYTVVLKDVNLGVEKIRILLLSGSCWNKMPLRKHH